MTIQLPKQHGAHTHCQFQCGVELILLLFMPCSDTPYELVLLRSLNAPPADIETVLDADAIDGEIMEYRGDFLENDESIELFSSERFYAPTSTHWYDVYAEVADRTDHYSIKLYLCEKTLHYE
jgi:hypothetical protein